MSIARWFLAALFILPLATAGKAADTWDGADKAKHFGVSALIGVATGMTIENRWSAFGVAMLPGLAKEIADSQKSNGHFSGKDLAADALGAVLGVHLGRWIVTPRGVAYQSAF